MPPFRSALSDNDRFGAGEAEATTVKRSRNKPQPPRRVRTSQPQKDSLTSSVKDLASDLGGFTDWRGDEKKPRKKSSGSGRRGKTSRRVHDCSFRSSGTSSTSCPSDLESPSPKPSPAGSTKQLNIESPTSAVDAPGEKRRGSMSEKTSKVNNTTTQAHQATMNKYKQLYEAILSDPANAFLFQENTSGEWVGLGDSVGGKGTGKPAKPPPYRPISGRQASFNSSTTPASPKPSPTELECRVIVPVVSPKTKSTSFHDKPTTRERPHRALSKSFNSSFSRSSDKLSDRPLNLSSSFNGSFQSKVADAVTVMTTATMKPKKDDRVQKALDKAKAASAETEDDPPEKKAAIEIDDLHLQDLLDQSPPASPQFGESMLTGLGDETKKRRRANSFSNTTPAADSERQLIRIIPSKGMKIEGGGKVNLGSGGSVAASISSITSDLSELKPTKRSEQKRRAQLKSQHRFTL